MLRKRFSEPPAHVAPVLPVSSHLSRLYLFLYLNSPHRARGEKIACDTLAIWGTNGVVHRLFDPLALWQAQCAGLVSGQAVPAGHFIPEELPSETAQALRSFMC